MDWSNALQIYLRQEKLQGQMPNKLGVSTSKIEETSGDSAYWQEKTLPTTHMDIHYMNNERLLTSTIY